MTATDALIGHHPVMDQLRRDLQRAAHSSLPVLVVGETGVGKELVVQALHAHGSRKGELVAVNVACLPEQLAEGELFGVAKGAYTGAYATRDGLIDRARDGTLFLDEACDLSQSLQVKILRVLESGRVRRIGTAVERPVAFRLVVTVQEDPVDLVSQRRWRADFHYRVSGIVLRVPALRQRMTDLALLSTHFLAQEGRPPLAVSALRVLAAHDWPGNVRELLRVVQRAAFLAHDRAISPSHLRESLAAFACVPAGGAPAQRAMENDQEPRQAPILLAVMEQTRTVADAARVLGVTERTVYRRLKALGADRRPDMSLE